MCLQLLPLMWLMLLSLTLILLALLKWLLVNRVKATSYQKYSWAFQTKTLNGAIQVHPHTYAMKIILGSSYKACTTCAECVLSSMPRTTAQEWTVSGF